jgi:hypothetical protein
MRLCRPWIEVPGDSGEGHEWLRPNIMNRGGDCVGISDTMAVWRFGFGPSSEAAIAYGVHTSDFLENGFVWVLATRKTGKVKEVFRGLALNLPDHFRKVIDWEPV